MSKGASQTDRLIASLQDARAEMHKLEMRSLTKKAHDRYARWGAAVGLALVEIVRQNECDRREFLQVVK